MRERERESFIFRQRGPGVGIWRLSLRRDESLREQHGDPSTEQVYIQAGGGLSIYVTKLLKALCKKKLRPAQNLLVLLLFAVTPIPPK